MSRIKQGPVSGKLSASVLVSEYLPGYHNSSLGPYLTSVTVYMETFIHGHNPHGGLLALVWHNWLLAHTTTRGKFPINKEVQ